MDRRSVLDNKTAEPVYLREHQFAAADGSYGHETRLDRLSVNYDFPATLYKDRNRGSLRPSEIVVFVGRGEAEDSLTPETFVRFVKLIFELDQENQLVVHGVPERFTDLSRFRGFGFLGREHIGRATVEIIRSRLIYRW